MDTLAPPVVAVVVAHDPGPWFEETLASLASQDYAELSVLILDADSRDDLTARVAAVLPTAFVRRLDENRGFGATVNEVRTMVEGADYFLVCHDDVALFPDAVHLMVEEAFRSNAGIVTPKVVSWDDPERLVHVGMTADKGGSVVDRVQPHEIDHGQHDAVRDVFVAPGGSSLIRADLFEEIGGFDPAIVAMGEDLDLCWRAQVVGARIIVAPDARVRHLEELAAGSRSVEPSLVGDGDDPGGRPVTLQALQRRHELLAVFKCYGPFHLVRVVPQVLILAIAEVVVAALAGNRARARAVVHAWRWNLARLSATRQQRQELKAHRRLERQGGACAPGGGERPTLLLLPTGLPARVPRGPRRRAGRHRAGRHRAGRRGGAGRGSRPGRPRPHPDRPAEPTIGTSGPARGRLSGRVRVTVWLIAGVVVLLGTRGVLTGRLARRRAVRPLPQLDGHPLAVRHRMAPLGGGDHGAGRARAPGHRPGRHRCCWGPWVSAQKVLIFGCVPLGVWGVVRLLRPFGSQRAGLVAGLAYLALALPYNGLALGRWGALVVYAGAPWVLVRLFRATGAAPFVPAAPAAPRRGPPNLRRPAGRSGGR